MINYRITAIVILIICLTFVAFFVIPDHKLTKAGNDPSTRTFQFKYTLSLKNLPENSKRLDVWIPVPQSTNYQEIYNLQIFSQLPYKITEESKYGNKILYINAEAEDINNTVIGLQFNILRKRIDNAIESDIFSGLNDDHEFDKYLQANRLVPIDGKIAEEVIKANNENKSGIEKVRTFYDYLTGTVLYDKSGDGWGYGDALYACDVRKGNCTDFHSLFIGMTRASGIPARFVIGFPVSGKAPENQVLGYHCWAEFYIENRGWIPVDISEAHKNPAKHEIFFGGLDANRVQFTIGRDLELPHSDINDRLNYFIYPHVLVDGTVYTDFEKHFSYSDLEPKI